MSDPRAEYEARAAVRSARVAALDGRSQRLSAQRVGTFIGAVAFGVAALIWPGALPASVALLSLIAFFVLVVLYWRNAQTLARATTALHYYDRALARLDGQWSGQGVTGDDLAPPNHPYAADLDLFGRGSLFELLCTARTRAGEETLAKWLLEPADPDEIATRQGAVEELRGRIDLREDLAVLGRGVRAGVNPARLNAWSKSKPRLASIWIRPAARVLAAGAIVTLIGWAVGLWGPIPFAVLALAEFVFHRRLKADLEAVTAAADRPGVELLLLGDVLARFEDETFESDRLVALKSSLETDGVHASIRIRQLGRIVTWLEARQNQFFAPLGWVLLWTVQFAASLEGWRTRYGGAVERWLAAVGELEALCALAAYAYENPADPFPRVEAGDAPSLHALRVGHPLIGRDACVRNDVRLGGEQRLLVVSGSNMSGKSTLLRTIGTNVILAQAGAPVRAESLTLSPLAVGATLRVQDSLAEGTSRFYAEITRLRQIMDLAAGDTPALFLLDEILHGTNSHDRKIGAEAVVRALVDHGAIGLVTTHDLALARTADEMTGLAGNVHFEDQLVDGKLSFDYRLRPGVVEKSNAIELMRAVGLDV